MQPRVRTLAAAIVVGAAIVAGATSTTSASGADQARSDLLRREVDLAARARSALLSLYSLETQLDRARSEVASVRRRSKALARERAAASRRLAVAKRTLALAERFLGQRLGQLYREGQADPLAVVLGADSLEDAISHLDGLTLAAKQDRLILTTTRATKLRLVRLSQRLAAREAELKRLEEAASIRAAELEGARAERAAYVRELAEERQLAARKIALLEEQSRAARIKARALSPPAATAPVTVEPLAEEEVRAQAGGGRTLRVVATGYSLGGRTATGIPVGWGVVAVDPSVIPLGTRLAIPGYGEGVAADVGGSVRGAAIDLWFPSQGEALAWGRRMVTISLH